MLRRFAVLTSAFAILLVCAAANGDEPRGLLLRKGSVPWETTLADARRLVEEDIRPNLPNLLRDRKPVGFGCERGGKVGVVVCNWACCVDLGLQGTVHFATLWFLNDRFYAYDVAFNTGQFPGLQAALVSRLGPPSKEQQESRVAPGLTMQGMSSYVVNTKRWDAGDTVVVLADRGGQGKPLAGHLYVAYLPIAREAAPPPAEDTIPRAKLPF
jgi:hypothetical protein